MLFYVVRRFIYMIILLFIVSIASFVIIQLPPGNYLTIYLERLHQLSPETRAEDLRSALIVQYGLDKPLYIQYFRWMKNLLHGDLGRSFTYDEPAFKLIIERLPLTVALSLATLIFTYIVAIPIGIYSAIHQYSIGDYCFTFIGFIGLSTPNFLLALTLIFLTFKYFGVELGGLFSMEYIQAPWSMAKIIDMINHMWIPIIVIGTAGTAGLIRVMRGCLLDELKKQYVITARAKGVAERTLLFKYPIRVAINPIISTIGWTLPGIVSGEGITAMVLNLPTTGPLLIEALLNEDMYLAGTIIMFLCFLTLIGTFISDLLLVLVDPRIQYEGHGRR